MQIKRNEEMSKLLKIQKIKVKSLSREYCKNRKGNFNKTLHREWLANQLPKEQVNGGYQEKFNFNKQVDKVRA